MSKSNYYPETVIVIPTYNEADNINNFLQSIEELNLELDLLFRE